MKSPLRRFGAFAALAIAMVGLRPTAMLAQSHPPAGGDVLSSVPQVTAASERMASFEKARKVQRQSPFRQVPVRSIGPTIMSGRVVDLAVSPQDPTVFYVAYATGGLWRTVSNGTAFSSLLDRQPTGGIGAVAVRWGEPDVLYVGTGESNSSRSAIAGAGVYKSPNGGADWEYLGLAETHSIGRILLSPVDTNVIYVAALGHLHSHNPERGVFKSTDGGSTWRPSLQVDDSTGVVDLVMDPSDPETLYAAAWHRSRKAWNFVEGGRTSGIYKTTDGGANWKLMSTKKSGFPTGRHVGRIGMDIAASRPSTLYAVVDNQKPLDKSDDAPALTFAALERMDGEDFIETVSKDDVTAFLEHYGFPEEYDGESVHELIRDGRAVPRDLADWVGESNRDLYDTDVVGCEVYRSNDGGAHWWKTLEEPLADVCESYGYYFGHIRIDPSDADRIYVSGVPLLKSVNGGETFENIGTENVHVDHHALWINPSRPDHLINGNDGGLNLSYDGGRSWFKLNAPPVGQFYTVTIDHADPYNVYGGLQDNGVWFGPSTYEPSTEWHGEGEYPYSRLLGGDGMMIQVSPVDNNVVYAGKQFGEYYRIIKNPRETYLIRPYHRLGEEPLRFNWLSPIQLSTHNERILYFGSQKVHRSMDAGETWEDVSGDLTMGEREGDVPFATLTTLVESPLRFGVLYAGSDDGLIHVSPDGGVSWKRISEELPQHMWIASMEPSSHEGGRVYTVLNGRRWDNFRPMVYVSENFGDRWRPIGRDLPLDPVNVIREDPVNPKVLYVGTDRGLFISTNGGKDFWSAGAEFPVVPVHDLRIQPEAGELVVATHGRSIFVMDVSVIQDLTEDVMAAPIHAFRQDTVWYDPDWGNSDPAWEEPDIPYVAFVFWSGFAGSVDISVRSEGGLEMLHLEREAKYGLNYVRDDLCICSGSLKAYVHERKKLGYPLDEELVEERNNGKHYLPPGSYQIEFKSKEGIARSQLIVME